MNGAGIALLIAAAGAGVLLLEHWRHGRQLARERAAGLHKEECGFCGFVGGHDDGCKACVACDGAGEVLVHGRIGNDRGEGFPLSGHVKCRACDGNGVRS